MRRLQEFEDAHILGAILLPLPDLRREADTALDRGAKYITVCLGGKCSMVAGVPALLPAQEDLKCGGFAYRVHGMPDPKEEHKNVPDNMPKVIFSSQRICPHRSPGLHFHHDTTNPENAECFAAEVSDGSFGLLNMAGRACYLRSKPSHRHDIWRTTSSTARINRPTDDNPQWIPGEP